MSCSTKCTFKKMKKKKKNILYPLTQFQYAPDTYKYKQKSENDIKARYMRIEHICCTKELL